MVTTINFNTTDKDIDYRVKSKLRNFHLPEFNTYINTERLSYGNYKIVSSVLIFDLPAIKTCLNSSKCAATCYARKAQKQYNRTRIKRETNLWLFEYKPELLFNLIVKQIKESNRKIVRLHSSGDFHKQSYIDFWNKIIKQFPDVKFYTYTKVENILDFSVIEQNKNFNLITSFINGELNYGTPDYILSMKEKYNSFICPATTNSGVKCGRECNYCVENKNVVFKQH